MNLRLRFKTAGLFAVLLVLGSPPVAHAKRRPPPEITPVVKGGIRYVLPHFGALHGKEQNGGYVQAWEVGSGKLLWDRMIYRVVSDAKLEPDAQDVFIVRIGVEDGILQVENELGERFEMDLASGKVRAVVKTSGRTEIEPQTVRVNGAELHYVDQGTGVPVVLVHGGLEDYRSWQPQIEGFSQRHRAIAYSRRYNYPNTRVAPRTDYSAAVDAEDLAALIRGLKLAPAHVVGVSYGAYVALLLAVRHPELVRTLVLSEAPVLSWLTELEGGKPLYADFMSKVWEPAARGFREGGEAGVRAAVDGFGRDGYLVSGERITFAGLPPEVRTVLLDNAAEWSALTASKDPFPALAPGAVKGMRAPVLMLSGQRTLELHKVIDKQLEKLLPQSQRIVLPDATHEMWGEYPQECQDAVLAFFAKH